MTGDPAVRFVNALLLLCLGLLVVNIALTYGMSEKMDAQTALLASINEGLVKPMSTTYEDRFGHMHTVNTPYQAEGLAAQHQVDLAEAFCTFTPSTPPEWWNPEECP